MTQPTDALELVAAWRTLRASVVERKRQIRYHRRELARETEALEKLEAESRRRGISIETITLTAPGAKD